MPFLRQSTIQPIRFGPFLDATNGVTEEVALTITQALRRLSKDGAAFAQSSETGNSTHDSDGWYFDDLTAADTDTVGELVLNVQDPATHLPVWKTWWVLEESIYDALFGAAAAGFNAAGRVDLGLWLGVAPLALVSQRVNTSVGAMASAVLTAAAIAAAAIEAGKFAAGAIDATAIAANAIGSSQLATDAIGDAQIATGAIASTAFAAGAINAAAIASSAIVAGTFAANAIDAAALAADAVQEIAEGILPAQNVAFPDIPMLFVAASDHVTPVTGATTITIQRSIDGATSFSATTGTLTEIANGMYSWDASAADMNGKVIIFKFAATGGTPGAPDDTFITIVTAG